MTQPSSDRYFDFVYYFCKRSDGSVAKIFRVLSDDGVMTKEEHLAVKNMPLAAQIVRLSRLLQELQTQNLIPLCHLEWTVLPVEMMKLTLITNRDTHVFQWERA